MLLQTQHIVLCHLQRKKAWRSRREESNSGIFNCLSHAGISSLHREWLQLWLLPEKKLHCKHLFLLNELKRMQGQYSNHIQFDTSFFLCFALDLWVSYHPAKVTRYLFPEKFTKIFFFFLFNSAPLCKGTLFISPVNEAAKNKQVLFVWSQW